MLVMNKLNSLWLIFFFILILRNTMMNAQNNTNESPSLNRQQQSIIKIAALTAVGDLELLKVQLNEGLNSGITISAIKSILEQLYAYAGFPRSLNAIVLFMKVIDERREKGIDDIEGKPISSVTDNTDKYEMGRKVLEKLTGQPQSKPAKGFGEFSPTIDRFLKEHLFADIFDNAILTYQQRELATISTLAAMKGVEPQLQSHLAMGKNTGLTEIQLKQTANLIEKFISRTQANTLRKLLSIPISPIIEDDMMVRLSEIEIRPEYLEEYKAILRKEAAISMNKESGVIAIFPIFPKENHTQIKIIEIYTNKVTYQSHLQTPHFQYYKTTTNKMVISLRLIDMETIDTVTMQEIFRKIK